MYIQEYKGFQVKPHPAYPSSIIVAVAGRGGKIPNILNTMFTSRGLARGVIDSYLDSKPEKEQDNAKAGKSS